MFLLTASGILVKAAGLCFRIPMNYVVGDAGMGYYNSAYSVYTFLYMLSTSGLPVALSVMISEARGRGEKQNAARIFKVAAAVFAVLGLLSSGVMLVFSQRLAALIRSDLSALSIAVTAPTMLFVCISCAVRGYFQGCGNMLPTAVSQLIEALGKLFIGIGAAVYAVRCGYPVHIVAAFALSGLTLGSLLGAVYLVAIKLIRGERDLLPECACESENRLTVREALGKLVKKSVPITVSASVMSLSGLIDTVMIQRVLRSSGMTAEDAAALYGNYTSLAVPMFNLPPVFVYPVAYSLVPVVASLFACQKTDKAAERIESALRYSVVVGLPCALGLSAMAKPILELIYKDSSADLAAPLLTLLAPASFFVCVLAVTNSVLEACGHEKSTVVSMLVGAAVKCVSGVFLLKRYGITGAPLSMLACYLTVTVINFAFVVKFTHIKPPLLKTFLLPLGGSVLAAYFASLTDKLLSRFGESTACIAAIAVAVAVYAVFLLFTGEVTKDEINDIIIKGRRKNET